MSIAVGTTGLQQFARTMLIALVAAGAYGSWAALAHYNNGLDVALRAGLTLAALTFTATTMLVFVLERLFRLSSNPLHGFWLASIVTSTLSAAWLATGHMLMGTPRVVAAVTPSVLIGTTLYFAYASGLLARARRAQVPDPGRVVVSAGSRSQPTTRA